MTSIKDYREKANLTQDQLAAAVNVGRTAVSMWESGDSMPRADKLPDLARILGCTVDDLFRDSEREKVT